MLSSRYEAEFEGRKNPHLPLQLIRRDPAQPPSLSLTLESGTGPGAGAPRPRQPTRTTTPRDQPSRCRDRGSARLGRSGRSCLTPARPSSDQPSRIRRRALRSRARRWSSARPTGSGVVVTKTYRLWQGRTASRSSSSSRAPTRNEPSSTTCSARTASRSRGSGTPARSARSSSAPTTATHQGRHPHRLRRRQDRQDDRHTALPLQLRRGREPVLRHSSSHPVPAPDRQDDRIDSRTDSSPPAQG